MKVGSIQLSSLRLEPYWIKQNAPVTIPNIPCLPFPIQIRLAAVLGFQVQTGENGGLSPSPRSPHLPAKRDARVFLKGNLAGYVPFIQGEMTVCWFKSFALIDADRMLNEGTALGAFFMGYL
jgi:hypothetical protein